MQEEPSPLAEATVVAIVGLILLGAGLGLGEWPAALAGLLLATAGLTVRGLAVFKA